MAAVVRFQREIPVRSPWYEKVFATLAEAREYLQQEEEAGRVSFGRAHLSNAKKYDGIIGKRARKITLEEAWKV